MTSSPQLPPTSTEVDAFLADRGARGKAGGSSMWTADLRPRRHRQPSADMGHSLPSAGGHVP